MKSKVVSFHPLIDVKNVENMFVMIAVGIMEIVSIVQIVLKRLEIKYNFNSWFWIDKINCSNNNQKIKNSHRNDSYIEFSAFKSGNILHFSLVKIF